MTNEVAMSERREPTRSRRATTGHLTAAPVTHVALAPGVGLDQGSPIR
jgi:hypothetical protein